MHAQASEEEAGRRRHAQEARDLAKQQKERRREEIYAINAILRWDVWACVSSVWRCVWRCGELCGGVPSLPLPSSELSLVQRCGLD